MRVSFMGLRSAEHNIREQVKSAASMLVEAGHTSLTPKAMDALESHLGFLDTIGISRRAIGRGAADFAGFSTEELIDIWLAAEQQKLDNWQATQMAVRQVRAQFNVNDSGDILYLDGRLTDDRDIKRARANMAARAKFERGVIKRSFRFLNRLIGAETTRMFVGGEAIRFEGRLAIYEFKRRSNLLDNHGGFSALSIYDRDHPEVHLCDVCIATEGKVPLLDHIASLVMHIQSGHEEEIVRIGNPRNATDEAYAKDWLVEHLPRKWAEGEFEAHMGMIAPPVFSWSSDSPIKNPKRKMEALRKDLHRLVYRDVLAGHEDVLMAIRRVNRPEVYRRIEDVTRAAQQIVFNTEPANFAIHQEAWAD